MKKVTVTLFLGVFLFFLVQALNKRTYLEVAKERMEKYDPPRKDYVIVIDYNKNIFSKRLYVFDMRTGKVAISSRVSHAWDSGVLYPSDYSNKPGSNKTSKGNFLTLGTRYGKFGYSMEIQGLDGSLNNKVNSRAVIFHSDRKMKTLWSNGCFATPEETNKEIIDLTKGGCLVCVID